MERCTGNRDGVASVPENERLESGATRMVDARKGWAEQFRAMAARGDDALRDADAVSTQWDEDEWEWESLPQPD
jgi:hypothetical protein